MFHCFKKNNDESILQPIDLHKIGQGEIFNHAPLIDSPRPFSDELARFAILDGGGGWATKIMVTTSLLRLSLLLVV